MGQTKSSRERWKSIYQNIWDAATAGFGERLMALNINNRKAVSTQLSPDSA